jgi:hypothetical protein
MGAGLWPQGAALGACGRLCVGFRHWRWLGCHFGGLVVFVNCCDEYGNCRQGRDCPVRIANASKPLVSKRLLRRFFYWLLIAMLGLIWMAFVVAVVATYA